MTSREQDKCIKASNEIVLIKQDKTRQTRIYAF